MGKLLRQKVDRYLQGRQRHGRGAHLSAVVRKRMLQPVMIIQYNARDELILSNTHDDNFGNDYELADNEFGNYEGPLDLDSDDKAWDSDSQ